MNCGCYFESFPNHLKVRLPRSNLLEISLHESSANFCQLYRLSLQADVRLELRARTNISVFPIPSWPSWALPKQNSRRSLGIWLQSWPEWGILWCFQGFSYCFHSMEVEDETLASDEAAGKTGGQLESQTGLVSPSLREQVWMRVELIMFRKQENACYNEVVYSLSFFLKPLLKQRLYSRLLISLFYFKKH